MIKNKDFTPFITRKGFGIRHPKIESWDSLEDKEIINVETIEHRLNSSYVTKAIRTWYKE